MSKIQNRKRFAVVSLTLAMFAGLMLFSFAGPARAAYAYFTQPRQTSFWEPVCTSGLTVCMCQGNDKDWVCCGNDTSCGCTSDNPPQPYCEVQ